MQLLFLTDHSATQALPGLDLLPHQLRVGSLRARQPPRVTAQFDLLLIDGVGDLRVARAASVLLAADSLVPRILVVAQSSLAAVTPDWGVSDVLVQGASPAEIDLRLRLSIAKVLPAGGNSGNPVNVAGLVIDEASFTAKVQGRALDLTYKEFELLHFLASTPGRVFTRQQLLSEVWGVSYFGGTRTVDVHIRRLRSKLGESESLISTVRGVGYSFAREHSPADADLSVGMNGDERQ